MIPKNGDVVSMRIGPYRKDRIRHFNHRRRGLATIVTTMIMLSTVAILGTTAVSWANSNLFTHQEGLEKSFSEKTNKISEFIIIENVWVGGTSPNKFLNITLTNTGNIGVTVTQIKINGITQQVISITDGGIVPGSTYSAKINYEWDNSNPLDVFVTTSRDSIFRTQVLPQ